METLLRELRRAFPDGSPASRPFLPDSPYVAGLETRTPSDAYYWDGLRRSGDPARPFVVFQVTLSGAGVYEDASGRHEIGIGRAFAAVIPGAHRYYLPATPTGGTELEWTFFFLLVRHPYVVERIVARQRTAGTAVLDVAESSLMVARAAAFVAGGFADRWAEEEALLQFAVAYDRHAAQNGDGGEPSPLAERERLLEETRRFVLERLHRPADVAELAASAGMSRSRFSHYFRAVAGQSPANCMARIRLEEVSRRLLQTDDTLARIADATGFADANHLCRAFRRHFHLSPGAFRRQVR